MDVDPCYTPGSTGTALTLYFPFEVIIKREYKFRRPLGNQHKKGDAIGLTLQYIHRSNIQGGVKDISGC